MPVENHSLVKDFPHLRARIHELKLGNPHFARLFEEYDAVEHDVHRIESGAEAASDEHLENLKKKRMKLKDELFSLLDAA